MSDMLILDEGGTELAKLKVETTDGHRFLGTVVWHRFPPGLADALAESADLIENQIFSLMDEAQEKILAFGLRGRVESEASPRRITDLQMYPNRVVTVELLSDDP